MSKSQGIDYGLGQTNIDKDAGIRFGVISQHDVTQVWCNTAEADYGNPMCPKCGNDAELMENIPDSVDQDIMFAEYDRAKHDCEEYYCQDCEYIFGGESAFPDEALGYYVDDGEYKLTDCLDSDIMVIKSPYYTYARFCSPCVPGACSLNNPIELTDYEIKNNAFVKCYCLGHDWFEDEIAPYKVFRVADNVELVAKKETVDCTYCKGTGKREITGYMANPENLPIGTLVECWVCNSTGKREEVIITEVKPLEE